MGTGPGQVFIPSHKCNQVFQISSFKSRPLNKRSRTCARTFRIGVVGYTLAHHDIFTCAQPTTNFAFLSAWLAAVTPQNYRSFYLIESGSSRARWSREHRNKVFREAHSFRGQKTGSSSDSSVLAVVASFAPVHSDTSTKAGQREHINQDRLEKLRVHNTWIRLRTTTVPHRFGGRRQISITESKGT